MRPTLIMQFLEKPETYKSPDCLKNKQALCFFIQFKIIFCLVIFNNSNNDNTLYNLWSMKKNLLKIFRTCNNYAIGDIHHFYSNCPLRGIKIHLAHA